jgi:hypothetical protein
VLQHFNTVVFLRSLEEEAGLFASQMLGLRWESSGIISTAQWGRMASSWFREQVPICRPGDLSRLTPHQAFVLRRDGSRTDFPVWFAPWFEIETRPEPPTVASSTEAPVTFTAEYVRRVFYRMGIAPTWTPEVIEAACQSCRPKRETAAVLSQVTTFFRNKACLVPEGLAGLPTCWLVALPGILWSLRQPNWDCLPFLINRVAWREGALLLGFENEEAPLVPSAIVWDRIRMAVNRLVYPNLWRPLARRHRLALWHAHPELRAALASPDIEV